MSTPQMLQHVADFVDLCFGDIEVNALIRCSARLLGPFFLRSLTVKNPMGERLASRERCLRLRLPKSSRLIRRLE